MILFNAYACDPEQGSEPGLGWNWVSYVARHHRTHLITADRGRNEVLLDAISAAPEICRNLTVTFLPWSLPGDRLSALLLRYYQPYYYLFYRRWMARSFVLAKQLCAEGKVSLVHQNTYVSYRDPGDFWRLPVPSVWGPVAGTGGVPYRFLPSLGGVEALRHGSRNILNLGHKYFNLRFRRAVKGYSSVIAASDPAKDFLQIFRKDVEMIPGNLITKYSERRPTKNQYLHLLFVGLHLSRKGGHYLIQSFARALQAGTEIKLSMVGEGVMTRAWKRMADDLGCGDHIIWHGRVERSRVFELLQKADLFVFPSLADVYPTAIAEAISMGVPVMTTDLPGVGDMVDDRSGYRLRADTPSGLIRRMAEVFVRLAKDPDELDRLRAGVRQRAEEFLFEKRMQRLAEIYGELLNKD
jgi:glycosyltransferase involved in cell wall biosynthesis